MKTELKTPMPTPTVRPGVSRRRLLVAGAAAGVAGAASAAGLAGLPALATHTHPTTSQPPGGDPGAWQPQFLTADQGRLLARLTDLIVPRTKTAGALDAGVPEFIDLQLSLDDSDRQLEFLGGLAWIDERCTRLHGHRFADAEEDQQHALLEAISDLHDDHPPELKPGAAFFTDLKRRVLFGYFTSEKGRVEALGLPDKVERQVFQGCTHGSNAHRA